MSIAELMVRKFSLLPYPVDLDKLTSHVQAMLEEHTACGVQLTEELIRQMVVTSLDILESTEYDEDEQLLGDLNHDTEGFYDYTRIEGFGRRDI